MTIPQLIKPASATIVFTVAILGMYANTQSRKIANETVNTSVVSIGLQSQAYCNEARYKNETNNGKCSGNASSPESRCTSSASGAACIIE